MPTSDRDITQRAEAFVIEAYAHAGKPSQHIAHSQLVGELLVESGCSPTTVAAGLLHDVVEDGYATDDEVREQFGDDIADLVAIVTEDPAIESYPARKAALRDAVRGGGLRAQLIFITDQIARLRVAGQYAEPIDRPRLAHYHRSLLMLTTIGHRLPQVDELRWQLHHQLASEDDAPIASVSWN